MPKTLNTTIYHLNLKPIFKHLNHKTVFIKTLILHLFKNHVEIFTNLQNPSKNSSFLYLTK